MNIEPIIAQLLVVRGVKNKVQAEQFLHADQASFYDPFLLEGMAQSVARIHKAIEQKESIRIYGDYDADGVSSTSLMFFLLQELQADFDFYIPQRSQEGYGLNKQAIEKAKDNGVSLMIT